MAIIWLADCVTGAYIVRIRRVIKFLLQEKACRFKINKYHEMLSLNVYVITVVFMSSLFVEYHVQR